MDCFQLNHYRAIAVFRPSSAAATTGRLLLDSGVTSQVVPRRRFQARCLPPVAANADPAD